MGYTRRIGYVGIDIGVDFASDGRTDSMIYSIIIDGVIYPPASEREVRAMLHDRIDEIVDTAIRDAGCDQITV